jgi:hypothetical protein
MTPIVLERLIEFDLFYKKDLMAQNTCIYSADIIKHTTLICYTCDMVNFSGFYGGTLLMFLFLGVTV